MVRPSLKTQLGRFLYARRAFPQRVIATVLPEPVLVDVGEFRMYVRLDDWLIGARIVWNRSYENYVARVMRPLLQPGDVMLDLGANLGYFTLLGAARVGPHGKVIAFEPGAGNCGLIRASIRHNRFQNIVLHQKAVADRAGYVGLELEGSNGKIVRDAPPELANVETVALDAVLANEPRITLVKMDIEGAEGLALRGMQQLIARHRPRIFAEFHPSALRQVSGMAPEHYLSALRAPGYELFVIDRAEGLSHALTNEQILAVHAASPYEHIDLAAFP